MSEQKTFFHIGYARAASTFLQKSVFPALTGIQYIPRNRFRVREQEKKRFKADKILMSRETGHRIFARCDAVYRIFGSRIIISLRRQDSLIASNYRLHVKRGFNTRFEQYLDLENDRGIWKLEQLEFMRFIHYVEQTTGNKPIVLIFEDYLEDPDFYIASLCAALDCGIDMEAIKREPVHKSYSDKQLQLRRQFADFIGAYDPDRRTPEKNTPREGSMLARIKRQILLKFNPLFMLVAGFAPDSWLSDEILIDAARLQQIKDYYQADWQACVDYVAHQNQLLGVPEKRQLTHI